jgi:hypothetical protein
MRKLTQSMVGMFLRCPQQFERRYIKGEIIPPGVAARRGSATHEAIRLNHAHKLYAGEDLPVDVLKDAARDEFVRLVKDEGIFMPPSELPAKDKILNDGLNAAVRLTGLYHDEIAPEIMPVMVEERVEMDAGLPLILSGGIDCYTADKTLRDFKTSGKPKGINAADESLQLTFYSGLLHHKTEVWPEKISLDVLVDSRVPRYQQLLTNRGPEDFARLLMTLDLIIQQIYTGIFPPCSPDNYLCREKWCGYWSTCKWGKK